MFFIFILLWLWFFVLRFVLDVLVCGQGIHREEQLVPSRRVGLKWWAQAARRAIIFVCDGKAVGLCSCVLPWIWCCGGWLLSRRDVSNSIRTINNTNTTYRPRRSTGRNSSCHIVKTDLSPGIFVHGGEAVGLSSCVLPWIWLQVWNSHLKQLSQIWRWDLLLN